MDGGDFNVYHDKKATFKREAEGYEVVAHAKGGILVSNRHLDTESRNPSIGEVEDIFVNDEIEAKVNDVLSSRAASVTIGMNLQSLQASSSGGFSDTVDIFGEDDEAVGQDTVSHQAYIMKPLQILYYNGDSHVYRTASLTSKVLSNVDQRKRFSVEY